MRTARAMIAAVSLAAAPAVGQQAPAAAPAQQSIESLSWLIGEWHGTGTMFGNPSEATLSVRPVLGGRFLELSYRAGTFEGRALYSLVSGGRWQAQWFDNRGTTFAIVAWEIERMLTSDWGSAGTEQGRTVYILADNGQLRVTDSVRRDGGYREFASHVFEKAG
jgi:hypothetical protein